MIMFSVSLLFSMSLSVLSNIVMKGMVEPEDLNPNLYDQGLVQKEENDDVWLRQYYGPLIIFSLFVVLIKIQKSKMEKALNKVIKKLESQQKKQEEPIPAEGPSLADGDVMF